MSSTPSNPDDVETAAVGAAVTARHPPARTIPARGEQIDRFLVLDEVGRGGMGEVLLGYDPELDRRVAIKLLRDRAQAASPERLLREAKALARLSHPNVVAVYEVGTLHDDEGVPTVWVAMEYVEGITLRKWLKTPRPWRETLAVVRAAGAGLAAAHGEALVHRDFKPANVMVGDDGRVRVLDFGLAREVGDFFPDDFPMSGPPSVSGVRSGVRSRSDVVGPTEVGVIVGTPRYMAPEQLLAEPIDARADQFAFCVVLYEAIYGCRPFAGETVAELREAILAQKLEEPRQGVSIPRGVRDAIRRGLAVDPDARHPSMQALLAELDRAARPNTRLFAGLAAVLLIAGGVAAGTLSARSQASTPSHARARTS